MSTVNHHKFPKPHAAQAIAVQTTTTAVESVVEPVVQVKVVTADFINPSHTIGLNNTNVAVTQKKRGRPSKSEAKHEDAVDKVMVTLRIDSKLHKELVQYTIKKSATEEKLISIQTMIINFIEKHVRN